MNRTRRVGLIILGGLLVIALVCLGAILLMREVTVERVASVLATVRDTTLETLLRWLDEEKEQANAWGQAPEVIAQTRALLDSASSTSALAASPAQDALRILFSPLASETNLQGYVILSPDNTILASSIPIDIGRHSLIGSDLQIQEKLDQQQPFINLPIAYSQIVSDSVDQVSILAAAPVRDASRERLGTLIFFIDPSGDFSEILQQGRLLNSGETYAVNASGVLISASRFEDALKTAGIVPPGESSILKVSVVDPGVNLLLGETNAIPMDERRPTQMAASVLAGETGLEVDGYRDYRGVNVVGAWTWVEEYGLGLATEVDWDESFSNLAAARSGFIVLSILSAIAMVATVVITHTSEQREQLSQKRYEMTVEGAKEAIISFDEKNQITGWNREAEVMFGWTGYEAIGRPDFIDKVIAPENREFYRRRLDEIRRDRDYFSGTRQRREMEVLRVDGTRFPVDVFIVPFSMGKTEGYSAVVRDLSDIKAAEEEVRRSHEELEVSYDATLRGWSHALDLRDNETEGHTQRVTQATLALADSLGIPEKERVHFYRGALLHDIGKIGVPDNVLLKPGALNDEEWEIMRRHPQQAYDMLRGIPYLAPALVIPRYHHEKWDGSGYPYGLKGEEIPFAARMFSIVDVWDALSSDRPYRKAWDENKVRDYVLEQSGKHFDPEIVVAFAKLRGWQ